MQVTEKRDTVPMSRFIEALVLGRKANRSNKEIAEGLGMLEGSFNVRVSQLIRKLNESEQGKALLEKLPMATPKVRVDAVDLLRKALDELNA
jgi:DNA-binding NarL/FixJ family response regulator